MSGPVVTFGQRRGLVSVMVAVCAVGLLVAGCGGSSGSGAGGSGGSGSGGSTSTGGGSTAAVVASQDSDWQTLDHQVSAPGLMWWETGGYDRLTAVYQGKVVPYLAKSWTVAPDNKSVTFKLRKGVKCQDGTPMTPAVVAGSFHRLFTVPKKGDNLVADFGAGPLSVSASSAKWSVTISTKTAFAGLTDGVASGEAGIICPAGLKKPSALRTGFYGSGPYELSSAVHGDQAVLKRNPHWTWGPVVNGHQITWRDLPAQQTWKITPEPATLLNDLATGSVQVGRLNNGPQVTQASSNDKLSVKPLHLNFPLVMSMQEGPGHSTDDPALRHALSLIVNPTNLNQAFSGGGQPGKLVTSFVQPFQRCYDAKTEQLYPKGGLAAAKKVLTAAGYTGIGSKLVDPDGKPVTIRIVASPALNGNAGPYLQNAFKPLGANVKLLNTNDISAMTNATYGGQEDVGVSTGQGSDPALTNSIIGYYAGPPISKGGLNVYGPSNTEDPTWSSLVNAALGSSGCAAWDKVQEYALSHYIMLPIAEANWYIVSAKNVNAGGGYFGYEPWTIRG